MLDNRFTLRSAVYLMLFQDQQILLSRRYNTGWMDGHYSLIAGHLDGEESVSKAMVREANEEAGIIVQPKDLIPATVIHRYTPGDSEYIDFFFAANSWQGEPQVCEPDKCDDMSWFSLQELPNNLLPYIKTAITNYQKHIPFSESGW
jgi:8-oxo-dGTP diphosphatase